MTFKDKAVTVLTIAGLLVLGAGFSYAAADAPEDSDNTTLVVTEDFEQLALPTLPEVETPAIAEVIPPAPVAESTPTPEYVEPDIIHEDDPRWDCRFDGNQRCGVEVEGMWYIIQFEDGSPMTVFPRPEFPVTGY